MKKQLILPKYVESFMEVFRKRDFEIYLVGGAVRNLLLEKKNDNWDFTTNAKPEEIQKLFSKSTYQNVYGTVTVPIKDHDILYPFEVTPYRKESKYSDARHPDRITWAKNIEEDLQRRDFTINALAYDGKEIIDIVNGFSDLKKKVIRAVGDPEKRFQEDALRLLRAVRFASQLSFDLEEKTLHSIISNSELILHVSWERIRDEFLKILGSENPADGIMLLRKAGLLKHILPEVEACFSIEQVGPGRHHIYDVGTHLVETLRHCPSEDVITRFAALLHDIGKAKTYDKDAETKVITFYDHEIVGTDLTHEIADRFRLSKKDREKLITLVQYHMFSVHEKQTDKTIRRFIRKVGKQNLSYILDVRTGDRIGSGAKPTSWRTELFKKRLIEVQKEPFTIQDLKITGNDVMKIFSLKPGPKVGKILQDIFQKVEDKKIENKRAPLLKELKSMKDKKVTS